MSYQAYRDFLRANKLLLPGTYAECGLCGEPLRPAGTEIGACGHVVHSFCRGLWPHVEACGHCLDGVHAARSV